MDIQIHSDLQQTDSSIDTEPAFSQHSPDLDQIQQTADQHDPGHLIVIANGGSITSFRALYTALKQQTDLKAHFVTTMEPHRLDRLIDRLDPDDTLLMPISKSGETAGVIESLLYLSQHGFEDVLAVTSDNRGTLRKLTEKRGWDRLDHPDITGRFSGATVTGLAPAAVAGLDIKAIRDGVEDVYARAADRESGALDLAQALHTAEQDGITELFTPFYSTRLLGFYPLLVQLMHETVCKDGHGQTVYGDLGPECQHHTIQRLFGGRKDVYTLFISDSGSTGRLDILGELQDIELRGRKLSDLDKHDLADSLNAEMRGVQDTLDDHDMPHAGISIDDVNPKETGRLLGFLQYLAYYSSVLRGVDPFTQPDVEQSKQRGFRYRFRH